MHHVPHAVRRLPVVIQAIEQPERQAVDQAERGIDREAQLPGRWSRGFFDHGPGVVTADEQAPTEPGPGCRTVDPGHGVLVVSVRLPRQREELVEVAVANDLPLQVRIADALQLELGPGNDPRQSQPGNGRLVEGRVVVRRADEPLAVRAQELEAAEVTTEGTGPVVILAVDIVCDGAADRHEPGARRDRWEPACGHRQAENFR